MGVEMPRGYIAKVTGSSVPSSLSLAVTGVTQRKKAAARAEEIRARLRDCTWSEPVKSTVC